MSRIFEALQQANPEFVRPDLAVQAPDGMSSLLAALTGESVLQDGAPTFAIPEWPGARLVSWTQPNSLAAEKLRVIVARFKRAPRCMRRVLVTSAVQGDGKSTVSVNLAITFASQGERTLLIDGDLHQPALASLLCVDGAVGFADWCKQTTPQTNLLQRAEGLPLWFLPAGSCQEQPLALLQSSQAAALMADLAHWFTWIVIDSPPIVPLADSNAWALLSDSILLVARHGRTPKKALIKSLESLDRSKLFTVVMNSVNGVEEKYYSNYMSMTQRK